MILHMQKMIFQVGVKICKKFFFLKLLILIKCSVICTNVHHT